MARAVSGVGQIRKNSLFWLVAWRPAARHVARLAARHVARLAAHHAGSGLGSMKKRQKTPAFWSSHLFTQNLF